MLLSAFGFGQVETMDFNLPSYDAATGGKAANEPPRFVNPFGSDSTTEIEEAETKEDKRAAAEEAKAQAKAEKEAEKARKAEEKEKRRQEQLELQRAAVERQRQEKLEKQEAKKEDVVEKVSGILVGLRLIISE